MSDRLTKVSIDSVLYDLGSKGINSYETLTDMVAEEISNLYDGCIAYCVEDEKYYQWKSTNEVITTYARWRELQFGNKFQVDEMPTPTAELDGSIVQFTGETNATYKKGWFYTCVFANEGYVQTSCTTDTRGDYYLKGDDGNYTLVQLDGTNFDPNATYYQKVNAVSRWDEISTQSTDNKVDKIDGKGLSTNDLTDELKEQTEDAITKAHEHTNKETLDKLNMSADGNLAIEKETDVSLELLFGKSLTKEQYEQMIADGTIQDDMVYVVDEEDTIADALIDDSATDATNKTWSAKKISEYIDNKAMYVSDEGKTYIEESEGEKHCTMYFTIYGNTMTIFAIQRASTDGKTIAINYPLPFKELPTIKITYGTPAGTEKTTKNTVTQWAYDQNYGSDVQNEMHFMIQGTI